MRRGATEHRHANYPAGAVHQRAPQRVRERTPGEPGLLPIRVPLGRLLATPGALAAAERTGVNLAALLARHARCDWGEVDEEDWAANDRALVDGTRLLSAYRLPTGDRVWVITESDRRTTTVILPEEY
jgi:hypothetical protein